MPALLSRRPLAALAATFVAVPLVAACGGGGGSGNADADPAAIVPARAPLYLEATVKPDGELADAVDELGRKLAGVDDVGAEIRKAIEKDARGEDKDFSWEKDVEPWLGDKAGLFFHQLSGGEDDEPQGAAVLATKDADKARSFLEDQLGTLDGGKKGRVVTRTYRDTEYKFEETEGDAAVVVDDYAVFGDEAGIKAALDAREGEPLAEVDAFKKARDQVPSDGLGFGYIGIRQLVSSFGPQAAALGPLLEQAGDQLALALTASPDAITVDAAALGVSGPAGAAGPGNVFATLPRSSWLAIGTADLGATLERALQQFGQLGALGGVDVQEEIRKQTGLDVDELFSWMGDAGVFVTGTSIATAGGALVVETSDRAATRRAIPRLARAAARLGGASVRSAPAGVDEGATLRFGKLPVPITLALEGDRFIIAVGSEGLEAALDASGTVADNPAFKDAQGKLGEGLKPSIFVDMGPVREIASSFNLEKEGEAGRRVAKALEALSSIVAGTRRDGDINRSRIVVGVK